jgi:hypothetical protein
MSKRKLNRSRRIVKKLLARADDTAVPWNIDAVPCDGGKRWVSVLEMRLHDLEPKPKDDAA